jgi:prevent-host-death family protein
MQTFPVRSAKAEFSKIVGDAENGEAATITRHGKAVAMIVPYNMGRKLFPAPNFADVLLSIPHGGNIVRRHPAKQSNEDGDQ